MKPEFKLEKTREFGELIADTFNFAKLFYKDLWQVFLKFIIPFLIPVLLLSFYTQYNASDSFDFDLTDPSSLESFNSQSIDLSLIFINLIVTVLSIVLFIVLELAILGAIKSYKETGSFNNEIISSTIKSQFGNGLGMSLLLGLILIVGFIACILPGIYFAVVFSVAFPLLVFKKMSVGEIINECFRLIKDNWWVTFGAILIFGIIISLIGIIFTLPAGIYLWLSGLVEGDFTGFSTLDKIIFASFNTISTFLQYLLNVLAIILSALIYFNLNEQKYGESDLDQINKIGDI